METTDYIATTDPGFEHFRGAQITAIHPSPTIPDAAILEVAMTDGSYRVCHSAVVRSYTSEHAAEEAREAQRIERELDLLADAHR